jgi:hypothetical protein
MSDLTIHPVYLSARAAIVAPERAIPLTVYATQKWLPRLGPERWSLVLLLRTLSIDAKRRGDGTKQLSCSWRQIADMLDVHEETVASWLKHQPIANDKPWRRIIPVDEKALNLALFIPRLRYAYETRNGKTRRIGFLLEILMEDPVVPEDEARLQKQIELLNIQQGKLNLETYRLQENVIPDQTDLPELSTTLHKPETSGLRNVNKDKPGTPIAAIRTKPGLHTPPVNPEKPGSQASVKQDYSDQRNYVNQLNLVSLDHKSEISGKNVNELDILIQQLKQKQIKRNLQREIFGQIIEITEELLEDNHSTGMLYKVLKKLYPERTDLFVAAVRVAMEQGALDPTANKGAVFVRSLREFAEVAGVDLGFQSEPEKSTSNGMGGYPDWNPGSNRDDTAATMLDTPSEAEAIWTETQLVLRHQMTRATFDTIIQPTVLLLRTENRFIVGVHSEMAKEWLDNRLHDIVQRALASVVGEPVEVSFELVVNS